MVFQSPSHRGGSAPESALHQGRVRRVSIPFSSGRYRSLDHMYSGDFCVRGFNPLLIGAGALQELSQFLHALHLFQSPSHRGGSAPPERNCRASRERCEVSIPFSSGRERSQTKIYPIARHSFCFNPLLIGAGALRDDSDGAVNRLRFNPLLIGAGALHDVLNRHFLVVRFNPLLIGAGALPFLKPALCQQPFRVYFSRTSQSNAFLSPQPSPPRPPPNHPNSHRSNHIHRFRAPPPSPTQFSQSPQTAENKPTTRKTAGPPPLPPSPSPWSSRRTSRTA